MSFLTDCDFVRGDDPFATPDPVLSWGQVILAEAVNRFKARTSSHGRRSRIHPKMNPEPHAGGVETVGDDIAGIPVHIGTRVAGLVGSGQVLVFGTVCQLWPVQGWSSARVGPINFGVCRGSGRFLPLSDDYSQVRAGDIHYFGYRNRQNLPI